MASEELQARLGPSLDVCDEPGLGQKDIWAFEYPCGMQLVYEFYRVDGNLLVIAESFCAS